MKTWGFGLLLLLCLHPMVRATPMTLIQTDFGTASQPVPPAAPGGGQDIRGVMPDGWADNSAWNPTIRVRYRVLTENGIRFWRVENGDVGRAQVAHPLPDITARGFYDLTMTARGQAGDTVECGIRLAGPPYTNVGPASLDLTPQWQTFHFRIPVDAQGQSVGFWFNFEPGVQMDITTFRLLLLSPADLVDEIKAHDPVGGHGNLARVTRFPLGLPVGWSVPSDEALGQALTIQTDPTVIGPSGTAALRVTAALGATVTGAPFFVPWTFAPHVLSLSLRGHGSGQIVVRGDGQPLATGPFVLSDSWQRVAVPFTPLFEGKSHDFQITVTGTVWIDALQVEQDTSPTPYSPPTPAEVALACPSTDAGLVRVQFGDEPDRVLYAVAGASPGDVLHVRVMDIYGDMKSLPPVPVSSSGHGTLRYAVFPARPYGPFRVNAWVTDARGRRRSGDGEIVMSRLRRPRFWGRDAPDSPFGVHINPSPQQALLAKAIGANWVRTHDCGLQCTGWSFVEPVQGQWQFDDADVAQYRNQHLEILGMLSTAPGWATTLGRPATGYWDRYAEPTDLNAWAEYVRRTTAHYKGVIHAYEIWNEPWGDYWGVWDDKAGHSVKTPSSVADFAALQLRAYTTAKAVDPTLAILGFNTAAGEADWTRGVLANGGLTSCDAVSYHDYTSASPVRMDDTVSRDRQEAVGAIVGAPQGLTKPVWLSEGNPLDGMLDVGMYQATVPGVAPDRNWDTADRLSRYVVGLLALGDRKVFLYTMHENSALGMGGGDWRTLVTADGSLHPCGAAYAALTWQLEGLTARTRAMPVPGVTAFTFAAQGRRVTVYTGAPGHAPYTIPHGYGMQAVDVFGNPVPPGSHLGSTLVYVSDKGRPLSSSKAGR